MKLTLIVYYARLAGVLLLISGFAKIVSACGTSHILQMTDSVLNISYRFEFWAVGIIEVAVAGFCFSKGCLLWRIGLVALLATNFTFYRIGMFWIGGRKYCPCMGNLTDAIGVSPQIADMVMKIILAFLLLGSYYNLFWLWRQKRKAAPASAPSGTSAPSPAP